MKDMPSSQDARLSIETRAASAQEDAKSHLRGGVAYLGMSALTFAGATYVTLKGWGEFSSVSAYGASAVTGLMSGIWFGNAAADKRESETLRAMLPKTQK